MLNLYPRSEIVIHIQVLSSDGGEFIHHLSTASFSTPILLAVQTTEIGSVPGQA